MNNLNDPVYYVLQLVGFKIFFLLRLQLVASYCNDRFNRRIETYRLNLEDSDDNKKRIQEIMTDHKTVSAGDGKKQIRKRKQSQQTKEGQEPRAKKSSSDDISNKPFSWDDFY